MTVMQLVYASRPFGYGDLELSNILHIARANNARDGVTGALICREDLYLQLLEGPRDKVTAAFAKINRDERHTEVTPLIACDVGARLFPEWAMRDDPAKSWMWTADEVRAGAVASATPDDVRGVFVRLAGETRPRLKLCPA
ncbi:MAG: BLUF domain-containing protein [Hyphomicrobiales bacterium]|nr:BLUF domain-containing protein [Hyphomicrobiales bacterium]